jgi:eukaryotic-like serine/threonine-protein kinase
VLDGQFRVDRFIGEGGFGVVYRGTHLGLSEPIAVKCLKLPVTLDSALVDSFVKRFRHESRIHYRLSQGHLHIARSIASGTTVAPTTNALVPYTVLEWLEGKTLGQDLADRAAGRLGGRSLADAVKLLDSAVDALAYAHAQGVVHRDLNPENLFLAETPAGVKLKVLDFGVAKIMADSALAMGWDAKTIGNVRAFTPAYGAPEQFDETLGAIGPWTDVYGVALVVIEVMTGYTVMDGVHLGEFASKAVDPNVRPTPRALGIPVGDEVEATLARAVAVTPASRPRDAGELWGLLKHAIAADAASSRSVDHLAVTSAAPETLRMADVPRAGFQALAVEAPRAIPGGSGGPGAATVRMSKSPTVPPEAPRAVFGEVLTRPTPADPSPAPASGPLDSTKIPHERASWVLIVVVMILVAGVIAGVWLLH